MKFRKKHLVLLYTMSVKISRLLGEADASTMVLLDIFFNAGKFNGIVYVYYHAIRREEY